jgi:hypothetical protein
MKKSRPHRTNRPHPQSPHRWSAEVTKKSDALTLEDGVFSKASATEVAQSLKRSADHSERRKSSPFRSAMSMLTFFINRAGKSLTDARRRILERAKEELRRLYGQPQLRPAQATHRAHGGHSRAGHERRR